MLFVAIFLLPAVAVSAAADNWQFWSMETVKVPVTTRQTLQFSAGFRYFNEFSDCYYRHIDVGMHTIDVNSLEIWVFLRMAQTRYYKGWNNEFRPYVYIAPRLKLLGLTFVNRFRLDNIFMENAEDKFKYRNLTSMIFPLGSNSVFKRADIYYELFFNLRHTKVDEQRLCLTVRGTITKYVGLETYYLHKWVKSGNMWADTHIAGITLCLYL